MFELSEEQKMLKANAHQFWLKEIDPMIDEREKRAAKGEIWSREETWWLINKLEQMGYVDAGAPTRHGGAGLSFVDSGILMEELGYFWVSCFTLSRTYWNNVEQMTPECRRKYGHRIFGPKKDMLRAAGISESNAGGSPMPRFAEFKSVLKGDYWICNGTKTWVTNGGVSDYIICVTQVDRGKGTEGIGNIFIDRHKSPYETREMHKLGWRCCSFTETFFNDCKVPKENMLGVDGEVQSAVLLAQARAGVAAMGVGLGQACVDASIKFVRETKRWGKPLAAFQLIQNNLVNMAVETDCARYLHLRAWDCLDRITEEERINIESTKDPRFGEYRLYSSMAKYFCCDAANRTAYNAVSIHGSYGLLDDLRIERYYRDARTLNIGDGTSEIQRLIVGRELTGISAMR